MAPRPSSANASLILVHYARMTRESSRVPFAAGGAGAPVATCRAGALDAFGRRRSEEGGGRMSETMRAGGAGAPGRADGGGDHIARAPRRSPARSSCRSTDAAVLSQRSARDEGRGRVPDSLRARPRGGGGSSWSADRVSSTAPSATVSSPPSPCRAGRAVKCVRGRDELCETFFAVNRRRGTPLRRNDLAPPRRR